MSLDVVVLYFEECPTWQTAVERVKAACARTGMPVEVRPLAVTSYEDAFRLGFAGSPTILLDGIDPFAQPGASPALACRLYATPDGMAGAPTVDQLVDVLRQRTD